MFLAIGTVGLLTAVLLSLQLSRLLGRARGVPLGLFLGATLASTWGLLGRWAPPDAAPADWSAVASVPSTACASCHPDHYESWQRTYHRTMTRDATPQDAK